MSYSTTAPDIWEPAHANDPDSVLSSDQCVIRNQAFFVRGLIELPVIGSTDVFAWGVWISLSRESFARASELWETPGRETERPYFGWLSTELSLYPESTTDLKTNVHTRPVGRRPRVELEPTEHPLAVEQRTGITPERVRQIAEAVLHPRR
ncbi:DUF2199 domain-containing protein [Streptomyces sp. H39-S7]|uniref:DUF2199 domain-containing protein n=1 Tax=Streptomyces sp. H39-S7 TaxID=3004357 RepID=UPI003FA6C684